MAYSDETLEDTSYATSRRNINLGAPSTSYYQGGVITPTQQPSTTPTTTQPQQTTTQPQTDTAPHSEGMTSAEQQAVGLALGAATDVGTGIIQHLFTAGEKKKAKREAQAMQRQERQDRLAQEDEEFSINRRNFVNEKKQLELQNRVKDFNFKYDRFISSIKKKYQAKTDFLKSINTIGNTTDSMNMQDSMTNPRLGVK